MSNQFFVYNEKLETYLRQAKHLLMLSMNGVVSENMSSLSYKLNYGVSLPRIVELSKRFPKDVLLANYFWASNCRELKIMATLLYPEEQFSEDDFYKWMTNCSTMELAEQLVRNLLVKLSWSDSLIQTIESAGEPFHIVIVYLLATRQIQLDLFDFKYKDLLLQNASNFILSDDYQVATSITRFLKFLSRSNSNDVLTLLNGLSVESAPYLNIAKEEVLTEINFY